MNNPLLAQMKLLINLAKADGAVAEREKNYIINIGRANGIYPDQLLPLFEQEHPLIVPDGLTKDQKFSYIFSMVQLMKIDERMYKEEIIYCSDIALRLGYNKEVMFELMLLVKMPEMSETELASLKKLTEKYLMK